MSISDIRVPSHKSWGRILIFAIVFLIPLTIVRRFLLPQSYEPAFTDIFEAVVVLPGALACGFAATRSSRMTRGLWAMTAAYLALLFAADAHDFLVDVHFGGITILSSLEFLGWCTYLPLALLIFFPASEEDRERFGWLPAVDFTQVTIVIVLAYFRLIYLHHVDLGRGWQEFGRPELLRNALISSGLLLRALVEPSARARTVYRIVGGAFTTIVLLNITADLTGSVVLLPGGRPAALMTIGIFAAYWSDRSQDNPRTARPPTRLRLALSVFAATPPIVALWLAHDAPDRYRPAMYVVAVTSAALFIVRSAVADHARHVTENELRKSELEYRVLFESAIIPVVIFDPDSERILQANAAACELYELAREDLVGACLKDFTKDVDRGHEQIADLLRTGACQQFETVHRTSSGREIDVSVSSSVIQYRGHTAILSFNRDISDRKRADAALRASEDKYRDLVENSEDLVCTHNLEGRLLSVNPSAARSLGYEVDEFLKIPMRDLIVPEYRVLFDEYVVRIKANGADKGLMCVVARSGEVRTWEYNNTLRTEGVDKPIVRGMAHDVTEKRRAELARQASEQRYRLLFEKNVAGVATASLDGQVQDCNDAWAHIRGYDRAEEVRGRRTSEFYYRTADREPLLEVLRREPTFVGREIQLRRKDGGPVWVLFNAAVLGDGEDGRCVVQATAVDIGERRHAEEALRHSEERFRVALKDSPITVFNQDCELRYTWIYNPQLYWQHEALGKTDAEIIGSKNAARLLELKRKVLEGGVGVREDIVIPDGGKNYAFDIWIEPLLDADGNVIGITGAAMDIARLREMSDRLQDARDKLAQEKFYLESEIQTELGFEEIIGQSPALRDVLKYVRVVAPTDSTVLLLGETGTGKELVARSVHALSSRHDKTFIKLNCAAVSSGLLESELFGHERGAFTGAVSQKVGRIELADKGTLFLDEIGELPLELQPKLLRVLQDREFERLGGVQTLHVDVRIISATNRDLRQDVADRNFREDLFYRLNVFPIELPALRARRGDVPILAHHFVRKYSARMGKHIDVVPEETMTVLQNWNWPGNVRELENMIERMVILSKGRVLAAPPVELTAPQEIGEDNLSEMEREHIMRVLQETNGVLSGTDGAASRLGIKRTTLQSMLKRFGIELQDFKRGTGTFGPS